MVITNSKAVYDRARYFKLSASSLMPPDYQHDDIGFNYRMSSVVAAIGLAQDEKADEYRAMRIRNHEIFSKYLADIPGIFPNQNPKIVANICWMNTIVVDPKVYGHTKDELITHLKENGIDTRLLFTGMRKQKAMKDFGCDCFGEHPVCEWLTENGFCLPSESGLSEEMM